MKHACKRLILSFYSKKKHIILRTIHIRLFGDKTVVLIQALYGVPQDTIKSDFINLYTRKFLSFVKYVKVIVILNSIPGRFRPYMIDQ